LDGKILPRWRFVVNLCQHFPPPSLMTDTLKSVVIFIVIVNS
jgi:hypothetical protein